MHARSARRSRLIFLGAASLIAAVELLLIRSVPFGRHPGLLGAAVTVDLVLVVPLLWLWLGVRRGGAPAVTVAPVAVGGWLLAGALLPAAGEGGLRAAAELAPALEIGLLAYLAVRVRRVVGAYRRSDDADPVVRLRRAVGEVLGRTLASRLLADEVTTIRYLVRPPSAAPASPARVFPYHRRSGWGAVVLALCMAMAVEGVAVHTLVARWSVAGAWVLSALTLYGALWLVADWRATRARPHLLEEEHLLIRTGLRWTARVPLADLRRVRPAPAGEKLGGEDELSTAAFGSPAVVLELDRPVTVEGPFGVSREVRRLGLAVDEPGRLAAALGSVGQPR